jgi:hypothetical protein
MNGRLCRRGEFQHSGHASVVVGKRPKVVLNIRATDLVVKSNFTHHVATSHGWPIV